jgi:hypothetical protein
MYAARSALTASEEMVPGWGRGEKSQFAAGKELRRQVQGTGEGEGEGES